MSLIAKFKRHGISRSARLALELAANSGRQQLYRWRLRNETPYVGPTPADLAQIESDLGALGVPIFNFSPPADAFRNFQKAQYFPLDYHGGTESGVWDEKLLEHWISAELLALSSFNAGDIYVDIAASTSPWAQILRERFGLTAFAIDLKQDSAYADLPYYRTENATATTFPDSSVRGASLHCAFEMFLGNDDVGLITEAARILTPGGKLVIAPLYMHTHYCAYSTPEFYGKGLSDPRAREYVRLDCMGVPSSRKYDAQVLTERVLRRINALGMSYRLLALRDKEKFGTGIYCHFILEVTR
jgi:ubiquinone/menaquinone biosynthesis C-methylase UbiE